MKIVCRQRDQEGSIPIKDVFAWQESLWPRANFACQQWIRHLPPDFFFKLSPIYPLNLSTSAIILRTQYFDIATHRNMQPFLKLYLI